MNLVPYLYDKTNLFQTEFSINNFFFQMMKNNTSIANKYNTIQFVLSNIFLSDAEKDDFLNKTMISTKVYFILKRFLRKYVYRQKPFINEEDLNLNKINENEKFIISLIHEDNKYLFHIKDLIKIINNSLLNNDNFFSDPQYIKNPYDNKPFSIVNLYNIYFFLKFHTNFSCKLFEFFYMVDFNLSRLLNEFEYILREYSIENYASQENETIFYDISKMCKFLNSELYIIDGISINKDFPRSVLFKVMKPYLLLYMRYSYSLVDSIRRISYKILKQQYLKFYKYNRKFGRKIIQFDKFFDKNKGIVGKKIVSFNQDSLPYDKNNFIKPSNNSINVPLRSFRHLINEILNEQYEINDLELEPESFRSTPIEDSEDEQGHQSTNDIEEEGQVSESPDSHTSMIIEERFL
jgi:hypothetical protein